MTRKNTALRANYREILCGIVLGSQSSGVGTFFEMLIQADSFQGSSAFSGNRVEEFATMTLHGPAHPLVSKRFHFAPVKQWKLSNKQH